VSNTVARVATTDTKSEKTRYLQEQIEEGGVETLVLDARGLGQP